MATALVFNKVTRCFPFKLNRKLFLKRVPCNQISNFLHNGAISKNMELNNAAETTNKNFENKITILSHYRQYLLENSDMYPSVFTPGKCPQNSNSKTLEFLNEMQVNSNNEEDREKLKIYLSEELTSLTYPEFLGVLNLFAVKKLNDKTNPWPDVVLCLDNECFRRKNDLSVDEILKITDILYHSQNFFKFNFVYNRLSKYCHKGKNFTNKQIVHLLYLLSKFSSFPVKENKFSFQDSLDNVVESLNCHELGIISYGIYKMGLIISHPHLFSKIMNKALSEVEALNELALNCICIALLHCTTRSSAENIMQFQEKMIPHIRKYNMKCLTHLVSCNLITNSINRNLFEETLKLAKENMEKCTSFTFSRFAFLCAKFNFKDEEFLKMAAANFRKMENYDPQHLIKFLKFSLCMGVYEKDLLTEVFSDNVAKKLITKKNKLSASELSFISHTLELEMPEIEGLSKLSAVNSSKILKMKKSYEVFKKKNLFSPALKNYILYSFEPILNELYGPECVAWMKPLLHYSGFYILKFDKNLNAQVIPQEFRIPRKKHLLRPPDDNHFWVTFFVIHNSNYGHCNDLDFITQTQIKHFELAGYTLIKVKVSDWIFQKRKNMQVQFIKNLVTTTLEGNLKEPLNTIKYACAE